jgi:hypothetical protein
VGNSGQGQTVAISADGNTVLVGGPNDNSGEGAAWVFTRNGSTWSQQGAKLLGSGAINTPVNARQGQAVSLSADGNTALIGGYLDNNELGAAWIFTRSGSSWVQQGSKLIGTGAIGTAWQGVSVAISADGNTALAGGFNDNGGLGAVWVFARNGSIWTQQGPKLVGSGIVGVDIEQGNSVAISADGNTAIEGGIGDSLGLGAAWVFNRAGGSWSQQGGKLVGVGAIGNAWQGFSVAISADGSTAIESGLQDNDTGATWVFTKNAGIWTQQGSKLIGSGGSAGAYQGYSVALSADGNTAIIGGFGDNKGIGAAWVFVSDGTTGIEEISIDQNRIQLFPNPNKGSFTLQTSYNVGDRYFITDMLGNVIVHDAIISDSQIIQIPEATEGIYTMVVTGAKPVRFIIMR